MSKLLNFIQKDRLYILLVTFIIVFNIALFTSDEALDAGKMISKSEWNEDPVAQRIEMEKKLAENRPLALVLGLASLLIFAVLLLGIATDWIFVSSLISGRMPDITTHRHETKGIGWDPADVARVAILFLFFGYMAVIIESFLADIFPALKNDNFRMMLNSAVLDTLTVVFILYFTVTKYKEKLISLGLSVKNLARNIFYGIVCYIAIMPVLIAVLAVILFFIRLTGYVPEKQPVVELFLKEQNQAFLLFTSIFAAVIGPIIEELFFRGFMYSAVRKYIGVFWAALITSALFAVLHTNVVGFLPIMVLGIALAYMYERTGTLVSSITVHMIHNLSMVFFVFILKQLS
ncbi:MAG: CPBP family intramembrane glutamic endopeptidase [Candidatus Omnitrophota bacterium]